MIDQLKPRDFRTPAKILAQDLKTMLAHIPRPLTASSSRQSPAKRNRWPSLKTR